MAAIERFLVFEHRLYAARTRYTYVECALAGIQPAPAGCFEDVDQSPADDCGINIPGVARLNATSAQWKVSIAPLWPTAYVNRAVFHFPPMPNTAMPPFAIDSILQCRMAIGRASEGPWKKCDLRGHMP